jgi:alpha-L-rhamnosidase
MDYRGVREGDTKLAAEANGDEMEPCARMKPIRPECGFSAALPVWPAGREREMNLFVGFRAVVKPRRAPERVILRLTASSLYRVFTNGEFLGHGPAAGPHGYFRVDEWEIGQRRQSGKYLVAIEVAGYNVNSFYTLNQASFLQAEVVDASGSILAATGIEGKDFTATILAHRVQKVQRYTFQRAFTEAYRLDRDSDRWRGDFSAPMSEAARETQRQRRYLPRRVPYPAFRLLPPLWHVASGRVQKQTGASVLQPRDIPGFDVTVKRWPDDELEVVPFVEMQPYRNSGTRRMHRRLSPDDRLRLRAGEHHILDFGRSLSGFIGARIRCRKKARLLFLFDELLTEGDVNYRRDYNVVNIVAYELRRGTYAVESFEPYALRYLKAVLLDGDCDLDRMYVREFANPDTDRAHFAATDRSLTLLFDAARETYRQNAVDVFTDCPGRERGGWLCDSFFTARSGFVLSGNTISESYFFENFLLPRRFAGLPTGMLPMCYPADHPNGLFIPNWALWFVLQLEEYVRRGGDRTMSEALHAKVMGVFKYFDRFRNPDGLLEGLDGWVFVDWSKANDFTAGVSYPTNMLYAGALDSAARLYGCPRLAREAEAVRAVVRHQSFDGRFFADNAVRQEGRLTRTRNRSEACQYYAFFFGVATPRSHPALWKVLRSNFGPCPAREGASADVHRGDVLVSWFLRLDLLSRYGQFAQVLAEVKKYFLPMAKRTRTLWELSRPIGSCNHGFSSHVAQILVRDVLGLYDVDPRAREITVRLAEMPLAWCEGRLPLGRDTVQMRWWKEGSRRLYHVEAPAGYRVRRVSLGPHEWREC